MVFKTEYEMELPRGYLDKEIGEVHKSLTLRLVITSD